MYLDDGLGGGASYEDALISSKVIQNDLEYFGFSFAHEKCNWIPTHKLEWLCFCWDMAEGSLRITEKRVNKLKASLSDMIQRYQTETVLFGVRFVAGIVGQVISTQEVFGDQVRLRTRYLYECVLGKVSWNSKVMVSHEAFRECKFWVNNIDMLNEIGTQLCHLTYSEAHDFHIFCDASETGFGGNLTTG